MKVVALLEVMNSDIELSWRSKGDTFGQCSFDIDGNKYYVTFDYDVQGDDWEISFGLWNEMSSKLQFGMTGTGNSFRVMSGVVKACREYLVPRNPISVWASAKTKSRMMVYSRLFRAFCPDWDISTDGGVVQGIRPGYVFDGGKWKTSK